MNGAVEAAFFCTLVLLLVICGLCEIREQLRGRKWPKRKPHIAFRPNPSITVGGAYAAPNEPQHLRRAQQ